MKFFGKIIWGIAAMAAVYGAGNAGFAGQAPGREFKTEFTTLRVLNAGQSGAVWHSGLLISMQHGWKTYWRVPGDGGVPPQFDWTGSENLETANVLMPVPHRFADENGEGIGYKSEVVFPVDVTPKDLSRPVMLALKMFYAVCNDICVPVQAEVKFRLDAESVSASDRFRLTVSRSAVPAAADPGALSVVSMSAISEAGVPGLEVVLKGLQHPAATDIFVETGNSTYFRKPKLVSGNGDETVWHLVADQYGDKAPLQGKRVRLTIADGETGLVHEGELQ